MSSVLSKPFCKGELVIIVLSIVAVFSVLISDCAIYLVGYFLGGSMEAFYLADNIDDYDGLILLGSYYTADLSGKDIDVISIYGSEDKVLNQEKYKENKSNLLTNFAQFIIDGGCHADFGMYDSQDGDGIPTITSKKQIEIITDKIIKFINC